MTRRALAWAVCWGSCLTFLVSAQESKKVEMPKPDKVTLSTSDGLSIHATFFPGGVVQTFKKPDAPPDNIPKSGKEVVPVILLHGYEGNRKELEPLAILLQSQGHAVMTVDLRGHGDSSTIKLGDKEKLIDAAKLRKVDFDSMINDVEAAKRFLMEKNNLGQLNLEMLCVMGANLGGIVGANWIAADWSRADLPAFKQGKYAKAFAYLSPVSSVKGYSAAKAWTHPIFQSPGFSLMLVAGKRDVAATREAKQLFNRLEKTHPLPEDENLRAEKQTLFLIEPDTELVGTKLVDPRARLTVSQVLSQFIALRLVNKTKEEAFQWMERKNPLAGN